MTTLSKEDVVRIAKDAGLSPVGRAGELMRNGDGRWVAVSALETIANLARADLVAENERLNNDLLDALDCKQGKGPTALATVIAERDELRVQLEATWYALAAAEADNERLREVIFSAQTTFDAYASIHNAKNPPDLEKASFNQSRSDMCSEALAQPRDDSALREMIAEVYEECKNTVDSAIKEYANSGWHGSKGYHMGLLKASEVAIRALAEKAKGECE